MNDAERDTLNRRLQQEELRRLERSVSTGHWDDPTNRKIRDLESELRRTER